MYYGCSIITKYSWGVGQNTILSREIVNYSPLNFEFNGNKIRNDILLKYITVMANRL